jgi:hypothetical protein
MRWVLLSLLMLTCVGCSDESGDAREAVTGPGVEIHCAGLTRGNTPGGVGSTSTTVNCAQPQ